MAGLQEAGRLGIKPFEDMDPVELRANANQDEIQSVIFGGLPTGAWQ